MVKGLRGPMSAISQTRDERLDKQMERQFVWRLTQTHEQKEIDRPKNTARRAAARNRMTPERQAAISAKEKLRRAAALAAMTPERKAAARQQRNRAGDTKRHARKADPNAFCSCLSCTVCGGPTGKRYIETQTILHVMAIARHKANFTVASNYAVLLLGPSSAEWKSGVDSAVTLARQTQEKYFEDNPLAYLAFDARGVRTPVFDPNTNRPGGGSSSQDDDDDG